MKKLSYPTILSKFSALALLAFSTLNSAKRRAVAGRRRINPNWLGATKSSISLLVLLSLVSTVFAQGTNVFTGQRQLRSNEITASAPHTSAIPFDQIGAVAGKQYSGDGLAVTSGPDGAQLRCAFQRLNGSATADGLWLTSTKDGATGRPFRIIARALSRDDGQSGGGETLLHAGKVEVHGQTVRFVRPALTEEYSVGIDGLQQDFVIERQPPGQGPLRLELEVDGAKAEAIPGGIRLVLVDDGRKMVYDRLKATDARGKSLMAKLQVLSADRLAVLLDDTTAQYPIRIDPTFSDANWISFGGPPGVSQYYNTAYSQIGTLVFAAAADNVGNLYIGGNFQIAGGTIANCIAKWNGSSWSALGSGMNDPVWALAVSGTNLFAGGNFSVAGGISAYCIAQWNGRSWSALGSGMNNRVDALTILGTNLIAGGTFTTAGGVACTNIAEWNGNSWLALGSGMLYDGSNIFAYVSALAASGTNLFVGGTFTTAGGVSATNIAEWNGSSWSALGSGMLYSSNYSGFVDALAVSGTNLFAGGVFTTAGGVAATNIAQWNGSSWLALGSGFVAGSVNALAVSGTNLFVGGGFSMAGGVSATNIAEWNGSSWSALDPATNAMTVALPVPGNQSGTVNPMVVPLPPPPVYALAMSGTNLFVGGNLPEFAVDHDIGQWNGTSWSVLGPGMNGLNGPVNALAVSGDNLYVAGAFGTAGALGVNNIAEWNGSSWSALGSGMNNSVLALAVSGTNLFAGGIFTMAGGVAAANIAEWNGSYWSALGLWTNYLGFVDALAVSDTNLFAGGGFTTAGEVAATNIAEWNGSSWLALGSGVNGGVYALAVSGTNLYAGGSFTDAGGVSANYIVQWSGSSWSALGAGMNNLVYTLAVSRTSLLAGGSFTTAGGSAAANIAQWNGSSWSALGSGMNGRVNALSLSGTSLFAGGNFTTAGGVPANNIAVWNGSSWSALGSGVNDVRFADWNGYNAVQSLVVLGNSLYVGGGFIVAGTEVSTCLAEANIAPPTITGEPANETLPIGDTANFGVSATGSLGFDYQWYFNTNTPVINGTNASLALGPAITNDDGYYQVVVNNLFGSATSTVAELTVLLEPNAYGLSNNPAGGSTTVYLGSIPGSTNYLYATTNLALPFSQWQLIATNVAAPDGLFQAVDPNTEGVPAKFYRLSDNPPISITNVSPIAPQQYQTITISGSGFGTNSPYNGDSDYLYILDNTGVWEAGYLPPYNEVTLDVTSWTDNQIVISGFTGYYDYYSNWTLQSGDNLTIAVWNPQTGIGPATYSVTVGP